MLHVGISHYSSVCDRCGVKATNENPLIALEGNRTPIGHKREQFHSVYLCKPCLRSIVNEFAKEG